MQIIVSSRLDTKEHLWLKSLTSKMCIETGEGLVLSANDLSDKDDKDNADSILQLTFAENPDLFKQLTEVPEMCEALKTLMKPELDAARSDIIMSSFHKGHLSEVHAAEDLDMSITEFRNTYKAWLDKKANIQTTP